MTMARDDACNEHSYVIAIPLAQECFISPLLLTPGVNQAITAKEGADAEEERESLSIFRLRGEEPSSASVTPGGAMPHSRLELAQRIKRTLAQESF